MAHMRLKHKDSDQVIDVWSVDAKELLASGEYSLYAPEMGTMEGVPGEIVHRPFDPTIHRESPASHPGDTVMTEPMKGTPMDPATPTAPADVAVPGPVVVPAPAPAVERREQREQRDQATAAREAAERAEAARKR